MKEYLTTAELAEQLSLSVKTIQNKKSAGVWKQGIHYVCPPGMGVRWKWVAVVDWMEKQPQFSNEPIPLRRHFA
jgi:hypothetical protein